MMFSSWSYGVVYFRLRDHVQEADNNPLLIFPEGTCVNNHYTVMFKKVWIFNIKIIASLSLECMFSVTYIVWWCAGCVWTRLNCLSNRNQVQQNFRRCLLEQPKVRSFSSNDCLLYISQHGFSSIDCILYISHHFLESMHFSKWEEVGVFLWSRNMLKCLICRQSFTKHLLQLMTSWAVVCDVWYLEPQNLRPGETAIEFAERYIHSFPPFLYFTLTCVL
jgi:hypothetical protein